MKIARQTVVVFDDLDPLEHRFSLTSGGQSYGATLVRINVSLDDSGHWIDFAAHNYSGRTKLIYADGTVSTWSGSFSSPPNTKWPDALPDATEEYPAWLSRMVHLARAEHTQARLHGFTSNGEANPS